MHRENWESAPAAAGRRRGFLGETQRSKTPSPSPSWTTCGS